MVNVLGVDLACRSWADVGFGRLSFTPGQPGVWTDAAPDCITRPKGALTSDALAQVIDRYALDNDIAAVALDGPQGWRQPNAPQRPGVGRSCEYEARTQGKTGEFGRTYPQTQHRWIAFCVEVFDHLLSCGHAMLVNDADSRSLSSPGAGRYHLLEVFPTSIWRSLGLTPLPGHRKAPRRVVEQHARGLQKRLSLPTTAVTDHHDNLQGIVSAVAAAALLGGPCRALPRGVAAFSVAPTSEAPEHRVEGLIWDAQAPDLATTGYTPEVVASLELEDQAGDRENPLLPDDRTGEADRVLERGVELFRDLANRANAGAPTGIGYAAFVAHLYEVERFSDVVGRDFQNATDIEFVIRLATAITDAAGGRIQVTKGGTSIQAGMDSFIWNVRERTRSPKAFSSQWSRPPYSREDWLTIFPDGKRTMLR